MLDEHRKQEYEKKFVHCPLMEIATVLHPTSSQMRRRRQVATLQNEVRSSTSALCMPSSGDLGFTADGHRVLEAWAIHLRLFFEDQQSAVQFQARQPFRQRRVRIVGEG